MRCIDHDKSPLGIIATYRALSRAKDVGLDLVEISPAAKPPVCRIMDFGKYKYEISKREKESKAKQHIIKIKEIKLHPNTSDNDYNYRIVQAREFLDKGFKVKISVIFRGREMIHVNHGTRFLERARLDLSLSGLPESQNMMVEGKRYSVMFVPVKK